MRDFIEVIIANAHVPVIIDAGIGRPSQAAEAMEMGADAVMAYTAIASAGNIPLMARAFKHAIECRPRGIPVRPGHGDGGPRRAVQPDERRRLPALSHPY